CSRSRPSRLAVGPAAFRRRAAARYGLGRPTFGIDVVFDARLGVADVKIDLGRRIDRRMAGGQLRRDPIAEPPLLAALAAEGRRHPASSGGLTRRQPVFVRRMPSSPAGPSTAPGGATMSASA